MKQQMNFSYLRLQALFSTLKFPCVGIKFPVYKDVFDIWANSLCFQWLEN